jgi:hypothetical protein
MVHWERKFQGLGELVQVHVSPRLSPGLGRIRVGFKADRSPSFRVDGTEAHSLMSSEVETRAP